MTEPREPVPPAKVYIEEWMKVREVRSRLELANLMRRTPGTITKKLNKPENIDLQWLAEFSIALRVAVPNLFVDPSTVNNAHVEHRPQLDELMALAADMNGKALDHLIGLMSSSVKVGAPPPAPTPESAGKQTAT